MACAECNGKGVAWQRVSRFNSACVSLLRGTTAHDVEEAAGEGKRDMGEAKEVLAGQRHHAVLTSTRHCPIARLVDEQHRVGVRRSSSETPIH
jgi:hypothetical protein